MYDNLITHYYDCQCKSHVLRVMQDKEDKIIYLDKFQSASEGNQSLLSRIKFCFGYLINSDKYNLGDIMFEYSTARKLGEDLMKMTAEKPKNMEFGKTGGAKVGDTIKITKVEKGRPSICDDCPDDIILMDD